MDKKLRINISLTKNIWEQAKNQAKLMGLSLSSYFTILVLKDKENKKYEML